METSIVDRIATVPHWYHQIEFRDGTVSPGINATQKTLSIYESLGLPSDFTGKRVLDIGCADGFYSFLAEKRGAAEVVAVDYRLPTVSGFAVAAELLESNVRHVVANVYDLKPETFGQFDFIFFVGVLYHLRNPLAALDQVRAVARVGASVLVETHVIDWSFRCKLLAANLPEETVDTIVGLPMWDFYKRNSLNNDYSNKWAPTLAGLHHICSEAQLEPQGIQGFGDRGAVLCTAVEDVDLEHHRISDSASGLTVP